MQILLYSIFYKYNITMKDINANYFPELEEVKRAKNDQELKAVLLKLMEVIVDDKQRANFVESEGLDVLKKFIGHHNEWIRYYTLRV